MDTSAPLTMHVAGGRFTLLDEPTARLTDQWRIRGERGTTQQDATLPVALQPVQALFLLTRCPGELDLVDARSIRSLRLQRHATSESVHQARVRQLQLEVAQHAEAQAALAIKYAHLKKRTAATAEPEEAAAGETDLAPPPSKRAKTLANESPLAISTDSVDRIPAASTFALAARAFPVSAELLRSHSNAHPMLAITPVHYPLTNSITLPRTLVAVDLRTPLTYPRGAGQRLAAAAAEELVYAGVCESLGLRLHSCDSAPGPAGVAPPFASSPHFESFLSLYGAFTYLWHEGFHLLPGAHFGAELVCYEDAPSKVHSTFLVRVLTAREESTPATQLDPTEESNLARMASGVNKVVLVVQPVLPIEEPLTVLGPGCACVCAFRRAVARMTRARCDASAFQWQPSIGGLQRSTYPNAELRRANLRPKEQTTDATADQLATPM